MSTALQMARPAAVLYGAEIGMSTLEVGILVAIFSLLPAIIAVRAGIALDRIGERMPIIIGGLLTVFAQLLPVLLQSKTSLYASQVLLGLGELSVIMSLQKFLGVTSTRATRDRNFAAFSTAVSLGALLGPFSGGFIAEHFSYLVVFGTGAATAAAVAALGVLLPASARVGPARAASLAASLDLFRQRPIQRAMLSGALAQYSRDIFVAYFPLYGLSQGLSPSQIGIVLSVQGTSLIASRIALPFMMRMSTRDQVLFVCILISGVAFAIIPLGTMAVTYLAAAAIGFGLGCGQPISISETYEASPPGRNGEVLGLRLAALRLCQFVAPSLFGLVGTSLGLLGVFLVNGAFLVGGAFTLRSWGSSRRLSTGDARGDASADRSAGAAESETIR
jgi:MFS family permease